MLDSLMNTMAGFMEKVSKWIKFPSIPWDKFQANWNQIIDTIAPYNKIIPITDVLAIMAIGIAISLVLATLFTIELVKSFIPMSGGK